MSLSEGKVLEADYKISKPELEKTKAMLQELQVKMMYNDIVIKATIIYIAVIVTIALVVLMSL